MESESLEKLFNQRLIKKINNHRNKDRSLFFNTTFETINASNNSSINTTYDKQHKANKVILNSEKQNFKKMKTFFTDKYKTPLHNISSEAITISSINEDLKKYKSTCSKLTQENKVTLQ